MACSTAAASWLNWSTMGSSTVCCNAGSVSNQRAIGSKTINREVMWVKPSFAERSGTRLRAQVRYSSSVCKGRDCSLTALRSYSSSSSSSSSSWVEEDEAVEDIEFESSPEGSNMGAEGSRDDLMKVVMQRLAEEDLEEAAKKYNYEDELFSQIDFAQINTFTSKAFSGNPAAVCYLPYEKDENWLQLIAREFNLPATAFVVKRRGSRRNRELDGTGGPMFVEVDDTGKGLKSVKKKITPIDNEFDIRWFTSTAELELCGHATLASAHMLFSSGLVEGDTVVFHSKKGTLKARKVAGYDEPDAPEEGQEGQKNPKARVQTKVELGKGVVELDFPIGVVSQVHASEAQVVSDALGGVETVWVGRTAIGDYLVELPSSKHVEQLQPRYEKMKNFGGRGGVIATAPASGNSRFDIISRFFVPKFGIPEDPVTGSAHCALGPYWATKLGKDILQAYQASPRGGELSVRVDFGAGRVYLQGSAVLLMAGTLLNTFRR